MFSVLNLNEKNVSVDPNGSYNNLSTSIKKRATTHLKNTFPTNFWIEDCSSSFVEVEEGSDTDSEVEIHCKQRPETVKKAPVAAPKKSAVYEPEMKVIFTHKNVNSKSTQKPYQDYQETKSKFNKSSKELKEMVENLKIGTEAKKKHNGILYKDMTERNFEIGLVDLHIPDLKCMDFVLNEIHTNQNELLKFCELLNDPALLKKEHFAGIIKIIKNLNSLKKERSDRVLNALKSHNLTTDVGVRNICKLLLCRDPEKITTVLKTKLIYPLLSQRKTQIASKNKPQQKKTSSLTIKQTFSPALCYILDKIRIKRPLTEHEEQRLVCFIRDLLKLSSKKLMEKFRAALDSQLLTTRQLETLVQLLPQYGKMNSKSGSIQKNSTLQQSACKDLSILIDHWPNLDDDELKRFHKHLTELNSMNDLARKNCLQLIKSRHYLNASKIKFLNEIIEHQNEACKGRLLIL